MKASLAAVVQWILSLSKGKSIGYLFCFVFHKTNMSYTTIGKDYNEENPADSIGKPKTSFTFHKFSE